MMKQAGVKARFVREGSTKYLVELLEEGLTDYILDGQTFDLDGVRSIGSNPRHVATSPFTSYNYHGKGNFASMVDAVVLGATEVAANFNANVVTPLRWTPATRHRRLAKLPRFWMHDSRGSLLPRPDSGDRA
jgi:citrate lyase subunit alpha/citrate CoA-transferase